MTHNIWHRDSSTVEEMSTAWALRLQFLAARDGEQLTLHRKFTMRSSVLDVATTVAKITKGRCRSLWNGSIWVEGTLLGQDILVECDTERSTSGYSDYDAGQIDETAQEGPLVTARTATYCVEATSNRETLAALFAALDKAYSDKKAAKLCWWYRGEGRGPQYKSIYLSPLTTDLYPEYYPGLEGGPRKFINDYLSATESLLLMAGPPGTGKTTLLRHMIMEKGLHAHVCYDEELMASDAMFQHFLMDKEADVLIIEDADAILTDRERDKNHLMSRFLNISDGLIKLPNKKLVFTTNLNDFQKVDSALVRPGRCFAILHTRALNLAEAQAAARVGKFPTPTERKEYTLAELFNQGKSHERIRRIGMGIRG